MYLDSYAVIGLNIRVKQQYKILANSKNLMRFCLQLCLFLKPIFGVTTHQKKKKKVLKTLVKTRNLYRILQTKKGQAYLIIFKVFVIYFVLLDFLCDCALYLLKYSVSPEGVATVKVSNGTESPQQQQKRIILKAELLLLL